MTAVILMLTLLNVPALAGTNIQGGNNWRTYKGAWFEIKYPATFQVRPSQRTSSAQGYDSAFFTAADGSVEFYVFSPQWNGDPSDVAINSSSEILVSQSSEKKGSTTVRRATIKARDNSYSRSFEDTEDSTTNTRKVFGIKYGNQDAYSRYRQTYLTFKQSLTQFAD